jgi:hypothetical protein
MRKAQSAMEFLMTYGWALLVMIIVIGILFYLGLFSPKTGTICSFSNPGFSCYTYKLTSNTSNVSGIILDLAQTTGHDIKVVGFNCTSSETWIVSDFSATYGANVTIPSGSHKPLNGTATNLAPLPCWKGDGSMVGNQDTNQYYRGKLYVHYIDLETSLDHKVIGDISGTVE